MLCGMQDMHDLQLQLCAAPVTCASSVTCVEEEACCLCMPSHLCAVWAPHVVHVEA